MARLGETGRDTVDVIVLGSGAGGMAAACVTAASGLETLVVEKTGLVGGTTAISGGMVWVPDNPKMAEAGLADSRAAAEAYLAATVRSAGGAAARRAYLDAAPEAVAWLEAHTSVRLRPVATYPDYYPDRPGATTGGRVLEPVPFDAAALGDAFALLRPPLPEMTLFGGMMIGRPDIPHFRAMFVSARSFARVAALTARYAWQRTRHRRGTDLVLGNALAGRLLASLIDLGVPILRGATVERLVVEDGRVAGVRIAADGAAPRTIRARRGVVLAAGGFSHDRGRRARLLPASAGALSAVAPGAGGDGLALAEAAGAAIGSDGESAAFWVPVSTCRRRDGSTAVFPHTVTDRGKPGLIAVARSGRRFVNEALSYHEFVRAMLRTHDGDPAIPAWLICDRRFLWAYGLGAVKPKALSTRRFRDQGYLVAAPTIDALAARIGVDPAGLAATVARHNADARTGVDTAFGRGGDAYQRHMGDPASRPNPCLRPIETPPFHAVAVHPGDLGTAAGLRTDTEARVLAADGAPIRGLFACGNDMQSIMRGAYPGPGITLGPALTFGYLAARSLAADPSPDPPSDPPSDPS